MGNYAKYWFKQKGFALLTKEQQKEVEEREKKRSKALLGLGWDGYGDRFVSTGSECQGIEFTPELEKTLNDFGFRPYWDRQGEASDELVYDTDEVNGKTYLYMLYAEATNVGWKGEFEEAMFKFKVPLQKWMEG